MEKEVIDMCLRECDSFRVGRYYTRKGIMLWRDKDRMFFSCIFDLVCEGYTLIVELNREKGQVLLVASTVCNMRGSIVSEIDEKHSWLLDSLQSVICEWSRNLMVTPIFPPWDPVDDPDLIMLRGFRRVLSEYEAIDIAIHTKVVSTSITTKMPDKHNMLCLIEFGFAHTNVRLCMIVYIDRGYKIPSLPSDAIHDHRIEDISIKETRYGDYDYSLHMDDGNVIHFARGNAIFYSNMHKSFVEYGDGVLKMRSIFFDHRIRMFQRLWRRWWYEPDDDGNVRFASRMYDEDSVTDCK